MPEKILIQEVGPRDGLQNESVQLTTGDKTAFAVDLLRAGVTYLEAGSFVSPRAVPAMADSGAVISSLEKEEGCLIAGLVLNERGLDQALAHGVNAVGIVTIVSDTFAQKNNRRTPQQTIDLGIALARRAREAGLYVRVNISPAWVCPYDGPVPEEKVLAALDRLAGTEADEIGICDTIGAASPDRVARLFQRAGEACDVSRLAAHFHDTRGFALANAVAALDAGVRIFDASAGGLGGCPFAPGARGNLATEDLVLLLKQMGYATGIDLAALHQAVAAMGSRLNREIGGRSAPFWRSLEGDALGELQEESPWAR